MHCRRKQNKITKSEANKSANLKIMEQKIDINK
jgi:hypothetical protein